MGNMSYCRFQNTEKDLRDCYFNMNDSDLSKDEFDARATLIDLAKKIVDEYGDTKFEQEDDSPIHEGAFCAECNKEATENEYSCGACSECGGDINNESEL